MQSKPMKSCPKSTTEVAAVTHPVEQMSPERVLGIVLWTALIVVVVMIGT